MADLHLDPWQSQVLTHSLGEKPNGRWSAFEIGLCVGRQNGKGAILEARELAGLFLLEEKLIIHSAHLFPTSIEHFLRMIDRVDACDDFRRRVRQVKRGHGEEGIYLKNGNRLLFKARSGGSGRGFTADCIVFDECMDLPESVIGNLMPTLSTKPNSQIWYTGSAVDQQKHDYGVVFARIRERGMAGDPGLAYFEYSAPDEMKPNETEAWALANPGMGIRISPEHIALEQASMPAREFRTERLGQGDWPATDRTDEQPISNELWNSCLNAESKVVDPVVLSVEVSANRQASCICAAGLNENQITHVEVIDHRPGTEWLLERLRQLLKAHQVTALVVQPDSPVGSLVSEFQDLSTTIIQVNTQQHAQACGGFYDAVVEQKIVHRNDEDIEIAMGGAVKRITEGASWVWSRKNSSCDVSPLVGVTLAWWGYKEHGVTTVGIWNLSDVYQRLALQTAVSEQSLT